MGMSAQVLQTPGNWDRSATPNCLQLGLCTCSGLGKPNPSAPREEEAVRTRTRDMLRAEHRAEYSRGWPQKPPPRSHSYQELQGRWPGAAAGFWGRFLGQGAPRRGGEQQGAACRWCRGLPRWRCRGGGDTPSCVLPYRQSSQPPWGLAAPKCPKIRDLGTTEHLRRGHIGAGGSSPSGVGVAAAHPKRSSPASLWFPNPKQPLVVNSPSWH